MKSNRYETLLIVIAFFIGFVSLVSKGVKEVKSFIDELEFDSSNYTILEKTYSHDVKDIEKIYVYNKYGNVSIIAEPRKDILITAKLKVKEGKDEDLYITKSGKKLVIEAPSISSNFKGSDLTIKAPTGLIVEAFNRYGSLIIKNTQASVKAENKYGNIEIYGTGDIKAENKYGSISIEEAGNVRVRNKYHKVSLKKVKKFEVTNDYSEVEVEEAEEGRISGRYCRIYVSNVKRGVEITTGYKDVRVKNVGEVKVHTKYSEVVVEKANNVEIRDNYGQIKLHDIKGEVRVEGKYAGFKASKLTGKKLRISLSNEHASIEETSADIIGFIRNMHISIAGEQCGNINLKTEGSNIEIILPIEKLSLDLDIGGKIKLFTEKISSDLVKNGKLYFGSGKCKVKITGSRTSVRLMDFEK